MTLVRLRVSVVALTSVAIACGGGGSVTGPSATPAAIRFAVDTLRLTEGEAQSVTVSVLDAQNHEIGGTSVTLTSETDGGATLSIQGRQVTGGSAGRATLVARTGSVTTRVPVLVFGHPAGINPERLSLGMRPYGVAVGEGFALVTQLDGGTVTRFSLNPFRITDTITTGTLGAVPTGISIDRAGTRALVANQWDPSVGIIDLATNKQTTKLAATSTAFRTIFSADGTRGYATLSGGALMVIDPVARTAVTSVPIVQAGNGIGLGRGDSLVYLSGMFGGISVVNTKTNSVNTLPLSGALQEIVAAPDGASLFVARESSSSVAVVSLTTGAVLATIELGGPSFGMAMSPDNKQLWVTRTSGSVVVIDAAARAVLRTITLNGLPRRIGFDRFGSVAVVSDEAGSVVMIH